MLCREGERAETQKLALATLTARPQLGHPAANRLPNPQGQNRAYYISHLIAVSGLVGQNAAAKRGESPPCCNDAIEDAGRPTTAYAAAFRGGGGRHRAADLHRHHEASAGDNKEALAACAKTAIWLP